MAVKTAPYFSKQCNGIVGYTRWEKKAKEERGEEEERETGVTGMELQANVSSGGNIKETQRWYTSLCGLDCFNNHYNNNNRLLSV